MSNPKESGNNKFSFHSQSIASAQAQSQSLEEEVIPNSLQPKQTFSQPVEQSHAQQSQLSSQRNANDISASSHSSMSMIFATSSGSLSSRDWNLSFGNKMEAASPNKWLNYNFTSIQEGSVDNSFQSERSREADNSLDFLSAFEVETEIDAIGFDSDDDCKKKKRKKLRHNPGLMEKPSEQIASSSSHSLTQEANIQSLQILEDSSEVDAKSIEKSTVPETKMNKRNLRKSTVPSEGANDLPFPPCSSSSSFNLYNSIPALMDFRIIQVGEQFHLIPVNDNDLIPFAEAAKHNQNNHLHINILPGVSISSSDNNSVASGSGSVTSSSKSVGAISGNPKHIYKTACETYRVQVGKGSRKEKTGKFSRNARSETDALWLCELALIINDCPPTLEDIVRCGNYRHIQQKGLVATPQEFAVKLLQQAELMQFRGLLRPDESQIALFSLRSILPPTVLACVPGSSVPESASSTQTAAPASLPATSMATMQMQGQRGVEVGYPPVPNFPRVGVVQRDYEDEFFLDPGSYLPQNRNKNSTSEQHDGDHSDPFEFL